MMSRRAKQRGAMKIVYDGTADALYVSFSEETVSRTEQLDAGTLIDLDRFGKLLGVEVIRPARRWLEPILERFGSELRPDDAALLKDMFGTIPDRPYSYTQKLQAVG